MPLIIPERTAVVRTLQSYVRMFLPELDPTVTTRRGFIGGLVKSLGGALHDWHMALKRYADREPFPQTATGGFLREGWWRQITKLDPNPAAPARGRVVFTGTPGTSVLSGQGLTAGAISYTVDTSVSVIARTLTASSLTRSGSKAIFETPDPHDLATGMTVTISGASLAAYNGTVTIEVTAANEFTYPISGTPVSPAVGTCVAAGVWGTTDVTATTLGPATNLDSASTLNLSSPPVGVNSTAIVTFGALGGGTDAEGEESYRERILEALGSDFGTFTGDEIEILAKTVPGVTRVFVRKATLGGTNGVLEGQVKIAFLRDGDANPIPSASEVSRVKALLVAEIMPAHTAEEDLIVEAPVRKNVDFHIASLSPDTPSMRAAIMASLEQLFAEGVMFATTISEDDYRCAIRDTYDLETRTRLRSFSLSSPAGDITVAANEMPFLGIITWL